MSFKIIISDRFKKNLGILKQKDNTTYLALKNKIIQIAGCDKNSIEHFKNLRGSLKNFKRVHISSFVLIFRIENDTIIFEEFDHHDKIYKKK
ncbi:MAG: addiction module toxin RelE [Candidatus Thermoplasmatota archaeon]|nr:addiction module toxin RelE [Candidatus Thermoplasmatota archaeon]MBU1940885.1 addiction module toxin RelE [Candidatus Thermoplasmatota archaeon]